MVTNPNANSWLLLASDFDLFLVFQDLRPLLSFRESSHFAARSFESVEFIFKQPGQSFPASTDLLPADKTNSQPHSFTKNFLLSLTTTASASKLLLLGDFHFHFDNLNSSDPNCIHQLLNNHGLVLDPTHRSGHIIDWLIAHEPDNLISSVSVTDQLVSDHKAILAYLSLSSSVAN